MAQIIKHRRGSLESISSATKRAGELLVVTGSAGITADNGGSLLFVGIDGSTATAANKVLQGSSVPDLTGANYDTSIDGIPFYDTNAQKLYILNKAGNVEIKATANTGGTGIVSGSAQVKDLLPAGTVSGSSQVDITSAQGYNALESRVTTNENNISSNTSDISNIQSDISSIQTAQGVQDGRLDSLESFETAQGITNNSVSDDLSDLFAGQNTQNGRLDALESFSSSLDASFVNETQLSNLSSSVNGNVVELFASASDHEGRIDDIEAAIGNGSNIDTRLSSLELFSGSQESKDATLASYTSSVDAHISAINAFSASQLGKDSTLASYTASVDAHISAVNTFSASQEAKDATLASYTSSVDAHISAVNAFSASQLDKDSALASYTGSVDAHISAINAFSASQLGKDSALATYTASVDSQFSDIETAQGVQDGRIEALEGRADGIDTDLTELFATASNHEGRVDGLETFQSDIETAIAVDGANVTINGNFTVTGTQTVVNSTTVQLDDNVIELNGSGAANAGLVVRDATNPNTVSGSLLWDSTNDYWKAGALGEESKVLVAGGDGVVSGSAQINLADVTGNNTDNVSEGEGNLYFTDARVKTKLNAEGVISGSSQVTISSTTGYTAFSSSLATTDAELFASASDHEDRIDTIEASIGGAAGIGNRVSSLEAFSGSQEAKDLTLASYTASVDAHISAINAFSASQLGKDATLASYTSSIDAHVDAINTFSASQEAKDATLATYTASIDAHVSALNAFSASQLDKDATLASYTSSVDAHISAVNAFSASQLGKDSALATYTASVDSDLTELFASASNHETRVDALEAFSSSLDASFVNETQLTDAIAGVNDTINALTTDDIAEGDNLYFTDARVKAKLNAEGVISGSSQVQYANISGISAGIVSGSSQLDGTTIDSLNLTNVTADGTFTGTFSGDGSGLTGLVTELGLAGDTGTGNVDLLSETLTVAGGEGIDVSVSGTTITIAGEDASTSNKGVASFSDTNFAVTSGNVAIKSGGVKASTLNADVAGTGLSLNGVDNSLEVDFGQTAGTAVEGNTSLTVQGTANEIEISGGSITLGAGGTVTIGLPDDVTVGNDLSVTNNASVGGDLTVVGNLFVQGTTTTVDSTTIQLGDNIIELNGSGVANGGLLVKDSTNPNTVSGSLLWDSTNDFWKGGALGSEKEFARIDTELSAGKVLKADANGLLVDTNISDDGTDVTIANDLIIGGLSANAFLYTDGNKMLQAVVPANAGDMIQWNGSSFVASNTVDGGTF